MSKLTNAESCRAYYAKNREKILAQKRDYRTANMSVHLERQRAQYAKHKKARVAKARQYRAKNKMRVNAKAHDYYHANLTMMKKRKAQYLQKHYAKTYAAIQAWRKKNPEKELRYHAKRLINEQTGMRIADVPDDLVDAKIAQLMITRWVREMEQKI